MTKMPPSHNSTQAHAEAVAQAQLYQLMQSGAHFPDQGQAQAQAQTSAVQQDDIFHGMQQPLDMNTDQFSACISNQIPLLMTSCPQSQPQPQIKVEPAQDNAFAGCFLQGQAQGQVHAPTQTQMYSAEAQEVYQAKLQKKAEAMSKAQAQAHAYNARQRALQSNYLQAFSPNHQQQAQKPRVTLAIPSPARITALENMLKYSFTNKSLLSQATTRLLRGPNDRAYEDDKLVIVDADAPHVLVKHRMVKIGYAVFTAELDRKAVESGGVRALMDAFPQMILDSQILDINKAIIGAALLDGGFSAIEKVMPAFYGEQLPVAPAADVRTPSQLPLRREANEEITFGGEFAAGEDGMGLDGPLCACDEYSLLACGDNCDADLIDCSIVVTRGWWI